MAKNDESTASLGSLASLLEGIPSLGPSEQDNPLNKRALILEYGKPDDALEKINEGKRRRYADLKYDTRIIPIKIKGIRGHNIKISNKKRYNKDKKYSNNCKDLKEYGNWVKDADASILDISHHGEKNNPIKLKGKNTALALIKAGVLEGDLKGLHIRYTACEATKGSEAQDFFKTLAKHGVHNFVGDAMDKLRMTYSGTPEKIKSSQNPNLDTNQTVRVYSFAGIFSSKATTRLGPSHEKDPATGLLKHTTYFLSSQKGHLQVTKNPETVKEFSKSIDKEGLGISVISDNGTLSNVFDTPNKQSPTVEDRVLSIQNALNNNKTNINSIQKDKLEEVRKDLKTNMKNLLAEQKSANNTLINSTHNTSKRIGTRFFEKFKKPGVTPVNKSSEVNKSSNRESKKRTQNRGIR